MPLEVIIIAVVGFIAFVWIGLFLEGYHFDEVPGLLQDILYGFVGLITRIAWKPYKPQCIFYGEPNVGDCIVVTGTFPECDKCAHAVWVCEDDFEF